MPKPTSNQIEAAVAAAATRFGGRFNAEKKVFEGIVGRHIGPLSQFSVRTENGKYWDPYSDDGDALRLLAHIRSNVDFGFNRSITTYVYDWKTEAELGWTSERCDSHSVSNLRWSIVRTAATCLPKLTEAL